VTIMKFKIIDKEKRGFARYCPTFARGYEGMRNGIINLKLRRNIEKLGNKYEYVRRKAEKNLKNAAENGADVSSANPALKRTFSALTKVWGNDNHYFKLLNVWSLSNSAIYEESNSLEISDLVKKCVELGSDDVDLQREASWALGRIAVDEKIGYEIVNVLTKMLVAEWPVNCIAAVALIQAADSEADISTAIPALVNALGDENIRGDVCLVLGKAAANEVDISPAIPALAIALEDKNESVRDKAARVLRRAAEKGGDIMVAIPALVKALGDKSRNVRYDAAVALENVAERNHETRIAITKEIMSITNSDWFMREAEMNSETFIRSIKGTNRFARKIDELERKAA